MALVTCSLCGFDCEEYKCLYDANGEPSDAYKVVIKYFKPSLFDTAMESSMNVICVECWQHISDFYSFQQWILDAQTQKDIKFVIKEELSDETNTSDINDIEIDTVTTDSKNNESSSEEISNFECSYCKKIFQNYEELEKHFTTHESNVVNPEFKLVKRKERYENSFKCETCGSSFSQYGNLRRHVRKQHAAQPLLRWKCKYCNKLFRKKTLLEKHKKKIHNNKCNDNTIKRVKEALNSKENNMVDSDIEVAEIYQQVLNVEEDQPNSKFTIKEYSDDSSSEEKKTKIQIHRPALEIVDVKSEIATDEESVEDISNIQSTNSNELNSDSDERIDNELEECHTDLECPRCNKRVKSYLQLKEHFDANHPDERCYINCCHMTLYESHCILEHLQYHVNPNAFKCTECGKCFKGRKGLSSHKLQVHSDSRSTYHLHLCCCKKGVERHEEKLAAGTQMEYDTIVCCQRKKKILEDDEMIAKWLKEVTCEICKAKFPYYSLLRSHSYYEHPGEKCFILCCQRKMSRISDTLEHIRFHLNPHLYRCKECNLDFSAKNTLAKHMRNNHRDSLPKHRFACDECDKTFEIRQILTRHKNVQHSKKV